MKIYHNPSCSKSRRTLALLEEKGAAVEVIEYLREPPTPEELAELCRGLGRSPREILRTGEKRFAELGLSVDDERSDEEWCRIMSENPILIERPIVAGEKGVALGRPPENVLEVI